MALSQVRNSETQLNRNKVQNCSPVLLMRDKMFKASWYELSFITRNRHSSCVTNLLETLEEWTETLVEGWGLRSWWILLGLSNSKGLSYSVSPKIDKQTQRIWYGGEFC